MDTLERVGALVGIAAFLALAVLAVLFFLQARDVRRLRNWAGQAPERAAAIAAREALEAELARAQAAESLPPEPSRWSRARESVAGLGGRLPVDPLYLGAVIAAIVIVAAVLTSGFGLLATDDEPTQVGRQPVEEEGGVAPASRTDVAVLNATSPAPGVEGISGVAQVFQSEVSELDYRVAEVGNAPLGADLTAVMYKKGSRAEAELLASRLESAFGATPIDLQRMSPEVSDFLENAKLALIIGRNYQPPPEEPQPETVLPGV